MTITQNQHVHLTQDRIMVGLLLGVTAMLTALSIFAFVNKREFNDTVIINDIEIGTHSSNFSTGITYFGVLDDGSLLEINATLLQSEFDDPDAVNGVNALMLVERPGGRIITSESDYFTAQVDGKRAVLSSNARIDVDDEYSASSESFLFNGDEWRISTVDSAFIKYPGGIATTGKLQAGIDAEGDSDDVYYELYDKVNFFLTQ